MQFDAITHIQITR